jgi:hypothetical protein
VAKEVIQVNPNAPATSKTKLGWVMDQPEIIKDVIVIAQ